MLLGIYGDCHLTKNMRTLQDFWNVTSMKSIHHMYNKFDDEEVEMVVCLGDFFDTPRLEAKHLSLVLPILQDIDSRSYPTYILLGNHEAESENSNILEMLSVYENIHPVTSVTEMENLLFLPYYADPASIDMEDKIVFTHHDIYGSALASGKTKAFFGIDPSVFQRAQRVYNGHVHLKSLVSSNIRNVGSLLVSQQGELIVGEYPEYLIVDTVSGSEKIESNLHSMIYLTIDESESGKIVTSGYDQSHCVLKVEYEDEIPENFLNTAQTVWRKKIKSINDNSEISIHTKSFDMKNYLTEYINKSQEISDEDKPKYLAVGMELLK